MLTLGNLLACSNTNIFRSVCCAASMKNEVRHKKNSWNNQIFLNNGLTYLCFTSLLRQSHKRLAIALNLDSRSCDLNNQWTAGPGAMTSRIRVRCVCGSSFKAVFPSKGKGISAESVAHPCFSHVVYSILKDALATNMPASSKLLWRELGVK